MDEIDPGFTPFQEGDVLFAKITPCMENGKGLLARGLVNGVGFGSTEFHVLRAKPGVDPRFLFHLVRWPLVRKKAECMMIGSAGQQRVAGEFFKHFRIDHFDSAAQGRIADVLDAADVAIRKTEAVIAKLKLMKTGLSHDLLECGLDAKGCLRPFDPESPEFRTVELRQIFTPRRERGIPGLEIVSVTMRDGLQLRSDSDRRVESELSAKQHLLARKGDLAYNMMRMWQGACGVAHFDCLISPAYVVLAPKGIDSGFAYRLFKSPDTILKFHNRSRGLTDDRLRLYYQDFATIPVRIPRSVDEQRRIAEVMDAHDARIAAEITELDKLKLQKTGLMHDLLTGRVPVTAAEVANHG
jgi:type I restriction enzyme S subunit